MLQIINLHATVAGTPILGGVSLALNAGEGLKLRGSAG